MRYEIGTTIYLTHTSDRGVITSIDGNMYMVRLPDGFEIPAFEEDLSLSAPNHSPSAVALKSGGLQGKSGESKQNSTSGDGSEVQYAAGKIAQPRGIYVALEGLFGRDGSVQNYRVWVVNEMDYPVVANLDAYFGTETLFRSSNRVAGLTAVSCGVLHYDDINDHPDLDLSVQRITTAGLDKPIVKVHRLKGKTVVQPPVATAIVERPVWVIDMFGAKALETSHETQEDLKEYAQSIKPKVAVQSAQFRAVRNIKEMAEFSGEIDLHIEALVAHKGKMSNGEILTLQLQHYEAFMDKAARMNSQSVFLIHGVGEGVLKSAIKERLQARHDVQKFHNHYHPKYGYGATEVIFG
jgi:Smr domain